MCEADDISVGYRIRVQIRKGRILSKVWKVANLKS